MKENENSFISVFFMKNSITSWRQDLHILSDKPSHL